MTTASIRVAACLILAVVPAALGRAQAPPPPAVGAPQTPLPLVAVTPVTDATEKEIAGLPRGSAPVILTWDRVYALVLVRARSTNRVLAPSLDLETLTRDSARFGVADFARFQTQFLTTDVVRDPGPNVLSLLGKLQAVACARRHLAFLEALRNLVQEQVQASSSGLNRVDLDAVLAASVKARERLDRRTAEFRDGLDELKVVLGLSPRAAVILDRRSIADFEAVFVEVEQWARNASRKLEQLYQLMCALPPIGDVLLDRQPVLQSIAVNPERLEEYLTWAAQRAVESRSDARFRAQENIGVSLELKIRRRIRHLAETRRSYGETARSYELGVRLKDQSSERLFAPNPEHPGSRPASLVQLLAHMDEVVDAEERLVDLWTSFRGERLRLYKDLGVLPYNDWNSYYADLSARRTEAAPRK